MGALRFPHYATHRPYHPVIEYAGWIRRLALKRGSERKAAAAIEDLARVSARCSFSSPCSSTVTTLRVHSPFRAMHLAIEHLLTSFARHAPDAARLVVKLHPLDSGNIDWRAVTGHIRADLGIADRLVMVDGGGLDKIVARCQAVVTVHSTVGGLALARGLPVIALGRAVYDIPGLTHQGELAEFWNAPKPPEADLFDAFRRVLAARCLIPGSFFSERGLRLAVEAAVDRLEAIDFAPPIAASSANDPQCSNLRVEDLRPRGQGPMLEPARCVRETDRAFFAERIDDDAGKPMRRQIDPSRG